MLLIVVLYQMVESAYGVGYCSLDVMRMYAMEACEHILHANNLQLREKRSIIENQEDLNEIGEWQVYLLYTEVVQRGEPFLIRFARYRGRTGSLRPSIQRRLSFCETQHLSAGWLLEDGCLQLLDTAPDAS